MWGYSFFAGLFIPIALYIFPKMLENLAHIATIIASGTVIVAYLDYRSKKKKENIFSVVEQLNFFRTEVLFTYDLIYTKLLEKNFDLASIRIPETLSDFDYIVSRIKYKDIFKNQESLNNQPDLESHVLQLMNQLEEFSWKILLNGTQDELALYAVHGGFVKFVEEFAARILLSRFRDKKKFEGIYKLYSVWAILISRESTEQMLQRAKREVATFKSNHQLER